jgi:hypothetical protein
LKGGSAGVTTTRGSTEFFRGKPKEEHVMSKRIRRIAWALALLILAGWGTVWAAPKPKPHPDELRQSQARIEQVEARLIAFTQATAADQAVAGNAQRLVDLARSFQGMRDAGKARFHADLAERLITIVEQIRAAQQSTGVQP